MLSKITINKSPYRATYLNQFAAVFRRSGLELIREPSVTFVKIAQVTFFALMFGLIYLNQDPNKAGIQNTSAAIFVFVTNISFSLLFPVVITFAGELPLFLREHWNGLYRSDVYFLCRNLVELPIYIILPIIFNSITYYMVGFRLQISCLADDYNTAMVLSTPLTFPLMLFGGFYINSGDIPKYISWLQYLSWFMYDLNLSINPMGWI
ncbi:Protein white [Armadillidium vulgare]|nr:Protein white [Armadillidium vulgare]